MNISKQELAALLNALPNTPENQKVAQFLQQYYNQPEEWRKPFIYNTSFAASAFTAGTTLTNNIAIQADADFLILAQVYTADVAAAGQTASSATYPLANVLLTNTGTGEQLMSAAVPVTQIFGNGQFPFVLPQPMLLPARSNLQVQANNRDAAQAYNLNLSFIGVKLFKGGS